MGFNWGGAAVGGLEGFAAGGIPGALAGGVVGGMMTGSADSSAQAASITNQQMIDFARENRNWSEYMSSTAHQREVKDLVAAGLNPVLSVTGGAGASGGMTSMPTLVNPEANRPQQIAQIGQMLVSSAQSLADIGVAKEKARTLMTEAGLNSANSARSEAERARIIQETRLLQRDADAETSPYGKAMKYVSMFTDAVGKLFRGSVSGSFTSAKGQGQISYLKGIGES